MATEEQLKQRRRRDKRRTMGVPVRVYPTEFEEAAQIVREAMRTHGMSSYEIAAQTGVHQTTVSRIARGAQHGLSRDSYDRLNRLVFEQPIRGEGVKAGSRAGSRVNPAGTVRRLQGLNAAGFNNAFLGVYLGVSKQAVAKMTGGTARFVYGATAVAVRELYGKLADTNPLDYGIPAVSVTRAVALAARHGMAPPTAWDEETIDDPQACPEWTGSCGTVDGYLIHHQEGLPVCPPCAEAGTGDVFDRGRLRAARLNADLTLLGVENLTGINRETVKHIENGRSRRPGVKRLQLLADTYGVPLPDLCVKALLPPEELERQYVLLPEPLAVLIAKRGWTVAGFEEHAGLAHGVLSKWLNGHYSPNVANGRKMAAALDAVWTDFYVREP
ncbi:helix-turn-helix domain-containing protein [Streptomyces sp. NPDC055085]